MRYYRVYVKVIREDITFIEAKTLEDACDVLKKEWNKNFKNYDRITAERITKEDFKERSYNTEGLKE